MRSALTTLGELGESATMEDLAAAMGVNKTALYRYFGSRAGLHRALIGRWVSRALSDFRAAVFAGPPAAEMIERGFLAYLDVLERERSTYLALAQLGHVAGHDGCRLVATYESDQRTSVVLQLSAHGGRGNPASCVRALRFVGMRAGLRWLRTLHPGWAAVTVAIVGLAGAGLVTGLVRFVTGGEWWNVAGVLLGTVLAIWWATPAWRLTRRGPTPCAAEGDGPRSGQTPRPN